jgi:hypothetical protein
VSPAVGAADAEVTTCFLATMPQFAKPLSVMGPVIPCPLSSTSILN